jgi:glutathione S-transferase
MLTLYGRGTSDSVQKALWALGETGRPFEHVPLGGAHGGLDDPHYAALNPHRRVPTLRDGEVVVWESDAIIRYLAARYSSGTLWPADPVDRSRADQWMAWSLAHLYGDSNLLFWLTVRTPVEAQDADRIARIRERVTARYRALDQHLSKNEYVAGEHFTMGDIPAGATLYRYFSMPIERKTFSSLERWYGLLQARAPYREYVMVSFEELRGRLAY